MRLSIDRTNTTLMAPALRLAAAALLLLCASVSSLAGAQQAPARWSRVAGQSLANAAARWGALNADVTVTLPAASIIDLRNATFARAGDRDARAGKAYSSGTLTLQGAAGALAVDGYGSVTPSTVIDTANRVGLVPRLTTAFINLTDVALVNLCVGAAFLGGVPSASPRLMGLFSLSPVAKSLFAQDVILYLPQSNIAFSAYQALVALLPWPAVRDVTARWYRGLRASPNPGTKTHVHATEVHSTVTAAMFEGTFTYRSLTSPSDPLLQFMRREGTLMEQRWCDNGTLVPAAQANSPIDPIWGPLWMVETLQDLLVALANATEFAASQLADERPVAGVMVFMPRTTLSGAAGPGNAPLQLRAPLILSGPVDNDVLPTGGPAVLDLTSRTTPLWDTAPAGQLLVHNLAIRAPVLPGPSAAPAGGLVSALTLTALASATSNASSSAAAPRTGALIELHNVTLVVPALDFLALLTLASEQESSGVLSVRACMPAAARQQAAALATGVQVLTPGNVTGWDGFTLAAYTGWGVNASVLVIQPQGALPASVTQGCALVPRPPAAFNSTSSSGDDGGSSTPVGAIVGGVVGGVALVAVVALAAVLLCRRRRRDANARSALDKASTVDSSSSGGGHVSVALGAVPSKGNLRASSTDSAASHAGPSAVDMAATPGSRLLDLVQDQERQLLEQAGEAPGGSAALRLDHAHEQLMSVAAARRPAAALQVRAQSSVGSGRSTDPSQAVRALAAQLQGDAQEADKVTLERVLGRGGGGTVYLGKWRGLPVAVKTMVFEAWEDDDSSGGAAASNKARLPYMRAIMETAISANLGHLHVVATYHHDIKRMADDHLTAAAQSGLLQVEGIETAQDAPPVAPLPGGHTFKVFLVQERLAVLSIAQELCTCSLRTAMQYAAFNQEDQKTTLALLHQVASGLQYLHGLGIIHGDLTPGNILLKADRADGSVIVKLADFGLSNRLEAQATHVSNFGAGTPFYVAPEVVSVKRTSPASDIFSFGVVAWEVLSRCQPFVMAADGTLRRNPLFPMFPSGTQPPLEVERLIKRCLSPHPQKRPHAADILAVLARHIARAPARGGGT